MRQVVLQPRCARRAHSLARAAHAQEGVSLTRPNATPFTPPALSNSQTRRAAGHFNFSGTEVFATRYDRGGDGTFYPMAWDMANHGVVGEDRSALYEAACNKC